MTAPHNSKVKTAVILAAGLGTRLQPFTYDVPKGLLEIEGVSLVERSIHILKANGIENIVVGTGHLASVYENLSKKLGFTTIHNSDYAQTGSFYTLSCVAKQVKDDFLILESDLLYEPRAIASLQNFTNENALLCSGFTASADEVFVSNDQNHQLINLSKVKSELKSIDAEMVGIWKVSNALLEATIHDVNNHASFRTIDYERAFAMMVKKFSLQVLTIDDLVWCEIDDAQHLERAKNLVWPKLKPIGFHS